MEYLIPACAFIISALLTALALKKLIPILKGRKIGQKILEIGPRWHKSKEGTPTMGGIAFIAVFIIVSAVLAVMGRLSAGFIATACYAVVNGLIGMLDDRTKFAHNRNEGLKAWQKFLCQSVATAVYLAVLRVTGSITTELYVPFFKVGFDAGFFYYVIAFIVLVGMVNSVNLADGIDGLASSETLVSAVFLAIFGLIGGISGMACLSAAVAGCAAGFLVYNFYPARVFMGDTGSLFFGAVLSGIALVSGKLLIIIPIGIMFVLESVSDILQVGYFKLTHGKRLFRMAPIHHHFEKCGWSEIRIVAVFSSVTFVFSLLTLLFDAVI